MNKEGEPIVTRASLLWIQVCAPKSWPKQAVADWANANHPTGIESKWAPTTAQHAAEHGYELCAQCEEHASHHHMLLVC